MILITLRNELRQMNVLLIETQQIVKLQKSLSEEEEEGKRHDLYRQHLSELVVVHVGGGGCGEDDGDEVEVVEGV